MKLFKSCLFCAIIYLTGRYIMGCVRLYPDIIVATEISSINAWENNPDSITVSIGDCLANQKTYASFIHNAFIGFEGKLLQGK